MPQAHRNVVREFHLTHDPDSGIVTVVAVSQRGDQIIRWEIAGTYRWTDEPSVDVQQLMDDSDPLTYFSRRAEKTIGSRMRLDVKAGTTLDVTSVVRHIQTPGCEAGRDAFDPSRAKTILDLPEPTTGGLTPIHPTSPEGGER